MEPTTVAGVGAPAAPPVPPALDPDASDAQAFQSLWDAGAGNGSALEGEPAERPDLTNAGKEGAEPADAEDPAAAPSDPQSAGGEGTAEGEAASAAAAAAAAEAAKAAAPIEKDYESLDEYLKDAGHDPEAFMALPVKVRVDGAERAVPLAELVKGYQLSSASYARMQEAASAKQAFASEQSQVRQALGVQIKQTQELLKVAQNALLSDFQAIDWNTLRTQDPAQYSAFYTDFQARNAAIQQTLQQVVSAEREHAQATAQQRQQAVSLERERLLQARPAWRDPVKAQAAHAAMTRVGRQLGFTDAELAQITDHRFLLGLDLLGRFSAQVGKSQAAAPKILKRVRAAPKMAAPGARQVRDPRAAQSKQLDEAWAAGGGRDDRAGAAIFERFVA